MAQGDLRYERHGDSFLVVWPRQHVGFGIERITDSQHGYGLQGFLTVDAITEEQRGTVFGPIRVGLEDHRSQTTIAETLAHRVNGRDAGGWLELLATACNRVSRDWRTPTATVDLSQAVEGDDGPINYLFHGMIPKDETTIWFGDGESAKSLMVLKLAVCHSLGIPTAWGPAPPIGKVLYLDWETTAKTVRQRLRRVCLGLNVSVPQILYRACMRSLPDEMPSIREEISKEKVSLVIIDSIGFAMTGALTDDEVARQALSCLRQMECTRLVVAHVNSDTARNPKVAGRPFGSVFFWNGMRSGIEIRRAKDDQIDGEIDLGLYHRKANDGWHHKPLALKVSFDGLTGPICFDTLTLSDIPDLAQSTPLSSRIRQILKQGAMDTAELAEALDEEPDTVRKTANRMADVIKLQPGTKNQPATWGLLTPEHSA